MITLRRKAKNAKGAALGYGGCYRCGDTWDWKEPHSTPYKEGRGCFPLCEECWTELTPEQRVPYYEQLWQEWMRQGLAHIDPERYGEAEHSAILESVRAGL